MTTISDKRFNKELENLSIQIVRDLNESPTEEFSATVYLEYEEQQEIHLLFPKIEGLKESEARETLLEFGRRLAEGKSLPLAIFVAENAMEMEKQEVILITGATADMRRNQARVRISRVKSLIDTVLTKRGVMKPGGYDTYPYDRDAEYAGTNSAEHVMRGFKGKTGQNGSG